MKKNLTVLGKKISLDINLSKNKKYVSVFIFIVFRMKLGVNLI